MKAAQINSYGGSEVVTINADAAKPLVSAGHVLVEVHAAGVNPADWKIREGYMKQGLALTLPATLGIDFSGVIHEIGPGVTGFAVGDEIFGSANLATGGSFAEFALADVNVIAPKPKRLSHIEASALPLAGVSAWQVLVEHIGLTKDQKILIHGGAGGIGTIAIQIAHHIGAYVIATASAKDTEYVKTLGADAVIDYQAQSFETVLHDLDAVFDTIGGETYEKSFKVLSRGGIIVSMLEQPRQNLMDDYGVRAIGQFTRTTTERLTRLAELIDQGAITVHVEKVFGLDESAEALEYLRTNHPRGKIVIQVRS